MRTLVKVEKNRSLINGYLKGKDEGIFGSHGEESRFLVITASTENQGDILVVSPRRCPNRILLARMSCFVNRPLGAVYYALLTPNRRITNDRYGTQLNGKPYNERNVILQYDKGWNW